MLRVETIFQFGTNNTQRYQAVIMNINFCRLSLLDWTEMLQTLCDILVTEFIQWLLQWLLVISHQTGYSEESDQLVPVWAVFGADCLVPAACYGLWQIPISICGAHPVVDPRCGCHGYTSIHRRRNGVVIRTVSSWHLSSRQRQVWVSRLSLASGICVDSGKQGIR